MENFLKFGLVIIAIALITYIVWAAIELFQCIMPDAFVYVFWGLYLLCGVLTALWLIMLALIVLFDGKDI